jgi:hypothetical protein
MDELKPCPFCGSGPARGPGRYTSASFSGVEVMDQCNMPYVWCGTCCAQVRTCDSIEEAVFLWNARATPIHPDNERLQEAERPA